MSPFSIVDTAIDPADYHRCLAALAGGGHVVALLGSGVSIWEPSNLPAGQDITWALADVLIPSSTAPIGTVRGLIEKSAFEHIMFRYPKHDRLRDVLSDVYGAAPCNPVHKSFARLLDRGIIEHIVTTNYDTGLEQACSMACRPSRMPQVVVDGGEVSRVDWSRPVIFKIHGCASPGRSGSIIANYEEEGELDEWKRDFLTVMLSGRGLLVCGYSGYDFEICPELISINPRPVYWNALHNPAVNPDALTDNARRVLQKAGSDATLIAGDMLKMLGALDGPITASRWRGGAAGTVNQLVDDLLTGEPDDWQLDLWRIWVLNGTGCSVEGIATGSRMLMKSGTSPRRKLDSLFALAESLFHGGFYMQSASAYKRAAVIARTLGELEKMIRAEVNVAECDRAAGRWLRAWLRLRKAAELPQSLADAERKKRMEGFVALKRVLLLQHLYQIGEQLGLWFVKNRVRSAAREELRVVIDASRKGSWFDFQHCEMLAKRFGINVDEIYRGPLTPMPSRAGFRQLGYFIGEMLALRDELLKPGAVVPPAIFRNIEVAHEIGCHPLVWKLSRAVARKVRPVGLPPGFNKRWRLSWEACEYTVLMRLFLTTLGRRYN